MMTKTEVYLGLGGNLGDVVGNLDRTIARITGTPGITDVEVSRYYLTSPVSDIPQNDYVNAVCRLQTTLTPRQLLEKMQAIEVLQGKVAKDKNAPRIIDIDILLYGKEVVNEPGLDIPHPRWMERLFVLQPLLELVEELLIPDASSLDRVRKFNVREYLNCFPNSNHEKVTPIGRIYGKQHDEECSIKAILDWKGLPSDSNVRAMCD